MADPKISKQALMDMTWEEQIKALFDLIKYVRDEQVEARNLRANDKREYIDLKEEVKYVKGELHGIGRRRDKTMSTSQKMDIALNKRMAAVIWYRDHVLAPSLAFLQTTIFVAILYLAFGGKIP